MRTVVTIGDCGTGKSSIVEKMTGLKDLSSDSSDAATKFQKRLTAFGGEFEIVDTPGQNASKSAMDDNMQVAMALNQKPVSLMLLTIKADVRIATVLEQAGKYIDRFIHFQNIIVLMVTHMDNERKWVEAECCSEMLDEYGSVRVVFSGKNTPRDKLIEDVVKILTELTMKKIPPMSFQITDKNFLQYFKICKRFSCIIAETRDRVMLYHKHVEDFENILNAWPKAKHADLVFQFNTFMTAEIATEQQSLAGHFGWDFQQSKDGHSVEQQVGYIASLSSQMRAELYRVRTIVLAHHTSALGEATLRKCPHCGIVWGKWEGCDSTTNCGDRPTRSRELRNGVFHGFAFNRSAATLIVTQVAAVPQVGTNGGTGVGCGKSIVWSAMIPVTDVRNARNEIVWSIAELNVADSGVISTSDVKQLESGRAQECFEDMYKQSQMKVKGCSASARTAVLQGSA